MQTSQTSFKKASCLMENGNVLTQQGQATVENYRMVNKYLITF